MRDGVINNLSKRVYEWVHSVIDFTRAAYNNKHSNTTQIILLDINESYTSKFFLRSQCSIILKKINKLKSNKGRNIFQTFLMIIEFRSKIHAKCIKEHLNYHSLWLIWLLSGTQYNTDTYMLYIDRVVIWKKMLLKGGEQLGLMAL